MHDASNLQHVIEGKYPGMRICDHRHVARQHHVARCTPFYRIKMALQQCSSSTSNAASLPWKRACNSLPRQASMRRLCSGSSHCSPMTSHGEGEACLSNAGRKSVSCARIFSSILG